MTVDYSALSTSKLTEMQRQIGDELGEREEKDRQQQAKAVKDDKAVFVAKHMQRYRKLRTSLLTIASFKETASFDVGLEIKVECQEDTTTPGEVASLLQNLADYRHLDFTYKGRIDRQRKLPKALRVLLQEQLEALLQNACAEVLKAVPAYKISYEKMRQEAINLRDTMLCDNVTFKDLEETFEGD